MKTITSPGRRTPDGSYGAQSSSQWNADNISDRLLEQALSAGSGYFSSWAEGWLGGFGKARISVRVNDEGDVTGSGDFLYPIYDGEATTFFTQLGLRTMSGDRVIGNFGLGQRFFPSENVALGYNVFLDQDFSRNHTRGGAGVEAWFDWVRLSANYYTPLSGWKDSEDYDSRLVEERPAEGYDARLTGYLSFYRNLAVTGALEQWKGDHVGVFGTDRVAARTDPRVWSYGLEWTPVPAFSASANQRHSGRHKETQFGLTFNYHFGMDLEDQLSSSTVAEMRTVGGSRHDFVNRQNEMILEYREKEGVFNIVLLWVRNAALNIYEFKVTDGFGRPVSGQAVRVSVDQGVTVNQSGLFSTDSNGHIQVTLTNVPAGITLPLMATLTAGNTSRTIPLATATPAYTITVELNAGAVDVVPHTASSANPNISTTVKATVTHNGSPAPAGTVVNWSFIGSEIYDQSDNAVTLTSATSTVSGGSGETLFTFTPSALGLNAGSAGHVVITGTVAADTSVYASVQKIAVGFDQFRTTDVRWYDDGGNGATAICGTGKAYSDLAPYPAPDYHYFSDTFLPTLKQLQAVSGDNNRPASVTVPSSYWSGDAFDVGSFGPARHVNLVGNYSYGNDANDLAAWAVCLR